jgi:3-methyladenine DNA glycosylase AlkD
MGTLNILEEIRSHLNNNIDEEYKNNNQKYHREKIVCYGVRTPLVRKIAREYFKEIMQMEKGVIFKISDELFKARYNEEATIAIQWISGMRSQWEEGDFLELERLYSHVDNWGKCDDFCLNVLSHFIVKFPRTKEKIKKWARSENQWKRRASAVVFIQGGSWKIHGGYLKDVFDVADILLHDDEDLVQKGYGWMLKIASESHQEEVFDFVMERRDGMPRTALRYAIEKMPDDLRKRAMEKGQ